MSDDPDRLKTLLKRARVFVSHAQYWATGTRAQRLREKHDAEALVFEIDDALGCAVFTSGVLRTNPDPKDWGTGQKDGVTAYSYQYWHEFIRAASNHESSDPWLPINETLAEIARIHLTPNEGEQVEKEGPHYAAVFKAMNDAYALIKAKPGACAHHRTEAGRGRVDPKKIGTGEGFEAYGHGFYLARNQKVAESYRNAGDAEPADSGITMLGAKQSFNEMRPEASPAPFDQNGCLRGRACRLARPPPRDRQALSKGPVTCHARLRVPRDTCHMRLSREV